MNDQHDTPPEDVSGTASGSASGRSGAVIRLSDYRPPSEVPASDAAVVNISFNRRELDAILRIYGRMVGEGEWKDYAIDQLKDRAVFSVFKRSGEVPLFRIEKNPKLAARQGAYSVVNANGMILKRGHELPQVLKVFDKVLKVID